MSSLNPSEASFPKPSFTLSSRAFCCAMQSVRHLRTLSTRMVQCHGMPKGYQTRKKMAKSGPNRLLLHSKTTLARTQSVLSVKSALKIFW